MAPAVQPSAERWGAADTTTDPASEPADIGPQRGSVTQQCGVMCIISERAVSEHGEREGRRLERRPPARPARTSSSSVDLRAPRPAVRSQGRWWHVRKKEEQSQT
ncbi:hypothetical protein EMIHUDRAFT_362474, partial [Emiliania huxleyi CCMP1516]